MIITAATTADGPGRSSPSTPRATAWSLGHQRPQAAPGAHQTRPQGGVIEQEMPIHISNVSPVVDGKPTRVRFETRPDGSRSGRRSRRQGSPRPGGPAEGLNARTMDARTREWNSLRKEPRWSPRRLNLDSVPSPRRSVAEAHAGVRLKNPTGPDDREDRRERRGRPAPRDQKRSPTSGHVISTLTTISGQRPVMVKA